MDGIFLIDKPIGWTSFDVVAKVRAILKKETGVKIKVGHAGTLDPLASGLLIILIGAATKKAEVNAKLDKTYRFIMHLGETTTTGDSEGEHTKVSAKVPTEQEIVASLDKFIGDISQIPPAYSAIKVNGVRAYKLARKGQKPAIEPRKVMIHSLELEHYTYPDVQIVANVSSGTYIRSLVEDIGNKLGTGAFTSYLRRIAVGSYNVDDALRIDQLKYDSLLKDLISKA